MASNTDKEVEKLLKHSLSFAGIESLSERYQQVTYGAAKSFDSEAEMVDYICGNKGDK